MFEIVTQLKSKGASGSDNFADEFANELFPIRIGQEFVGRETRTDKSPRLNLAGENGFLSGGAGNTKAIEGDVPGQFFPVRLGQIFSDAAGNSCLSKHCGNLMHARLRQTAELAHNDSTVVDVMNHAGLRAVETNEAEAAENLFGSKDFCQLFLVAEAVLKSNDCRGGANQRRNQFRQTVVRGRFEADQHHISHPDFLGMPGADWMNVKVAITALDGYSFAANYFVI